MKGTYGMVDDYRSIDISRNLEIVREKIHECAMKVGRNPAEIRLLVVSKSQPIEVIWAAIEAGVCEFGENYPEEAEKKIDLVKPIRGDVRWHMIGHIQSRKSAIVADKIDLIHSLDSLHLADKLDRVLASKQKRMPVFLEFNVSGEESKYGFQAWDEYRWDELIPDVMNITHLNYLDVCGVMTMPPYFENPDETRPYFQKLMRLRTYLQSVSPDIHLPEVSMGTSGDYGVAIEEGATYLRIGQAILGARPLRTS